MAKTTENKETQETQENKEMLSQLAELDAKIAELERVKDEVDARLAQLDDVIKITEKGDTVGKNAPVIQSEGFTERVKIKLQRIPGDKSGDMFVCVNGRRYQIKRGVEVEVPRAVAEVLRISEEQDLAAEMYIESVRSVEPQ